MSQLAPSDEDVRDAFEVGGNFPPFEVPTTERRRIFDEWLTEKSAPARKAHLFERLAQALLHVAGHDRRCEVAISGDGRCQGAAVGVRWEAGFLDAVCQSHADTATARGAYVITASRADGTEEADHG